MGRNVQHSVPVSEFLLRHGNAPTRLQTHSNTLCTWKHTLTHPLAVTHKAHVEQTWKNMELLDFLYINYILEVYQHVWICVCMYVSMSLMVFLPRACVLSLNTLSLNRNRSVI